MPFPHHPFTDQTADGEHDDRMFEAVRRNDFPRNHLRFSQATRIRAKFGRNDSGMADVRGTLSCELEAHLVVRINRPLARGAPCSNYFKVSVRNYD